MPILLKLFQKIEEERTLPNSFYKTNMTLIARPDKDTMRKEGYKPISLMNIDSNIMNKTLANQIQQYIERIVHHDHLHFIPVIQNGSTYPHQ